MQALLDDLRKQYDMTKDRGILTAIRRVEKELGK
jgi:hypothetical protein